LIKEQLQKELLSLLDKHGYQLKRVGYEIIDWEGRQKHTRLSASRNVLYDGSTAEPVFRIVRKV